MRYRLLCYWSGVFFTKHQKTFITLTLFDYQIVQACLTEMEIYHLIFNAGRLAYHIVQNTVVITYKINKICWRSWRCWPLICWWHTLSRLYRCRSFGNLIKKNIENKNPEKLLLSYIFRFLWMHIQLLFLTKG